VGSTEFGTRTELKNLNSFRVLADGTAFEIARQTAVLQSGGKVVQETRGWHDARRETFSQRSKEEAEDYRYFPEPDLPPLHLDNAWIEAVRASLPELPDAKIARYMADYDLSEYDARVLSEERAVGEWFDTAVTHTASPPTTPKLIANWMINELFRLMNEARLSIDAIEVTPAALVELIGLVEKQTINHNTAKDVLAEMFVSGAAPAQIVADKGLAQISDDVAIAAIIDQILNENPDQLTRYLGGEEKLQGWFVGQVMRQTKGKANPAVVNRLLQSALASRK
jgi:aspartyl-tRNA(Asn)/glutamyl-tRNA(Gln) amidotransferase subunit B